MIQKEGVLAYGPGEAAFNQAWHDDGAELHPAGGEEIANKDAFCIERAYVHRGRRQGCSYASDPLADRNRLAE